jgi:hypothetical protein
MEKVVNIVKQEDQDEQYIAFWLTKTPAERMLEVKRLRYNYYMWLNNSFPDKIEKVLSKRPL